MKRAISRGAFLVVIVVAAQLAGCASDKVGQGVANEVEYRRVLEFQKQKASTAQDEEMDRKIQNETKRIRKNRRPLSSGG